MIKKLLACGAIAIFSAVAAGNAWSHSGSTAFIELEVELETNDNTASGAWWLALKDLQIAVGLDHDWDDQITYAEFKRSREDILLYAQQHLRVSSSSGSCVIEWQTPSLSRLDDGIYARLPMAIMCPGGYALSALSYSALFDVDTTHRAIVKLNGTETTRVLIFSPDSSEQRWDVNKTGAWRNFSVYVEQGVIHILEGYDHLLFLLALLVPIVFSRRQEKVTGGEARIIHYRDLAVSLLKVVTAFTLGHSITLILASVFSISPPSSWVETFIAFSVVLAGVNIVLPMFREASWRVVALFGLVHGFGFASVLAELTLDRGSLALSLLSFNLGVELGQLLVVMITMPLLIGLARGSYLPSLARYGAATTAVSVGLIWAVERVPW